jgi:hypothetical protein
MDTSKAVEDLIDRLVADLAPLVRRVALDAMKSALTGCPPVPKVFSSGSTTSNPSVGMTAVGLPKPKEGVPPPTVQAVPPSKPTVAAEPPVAPPAHPASTALPTRATPGTAKATDGAPAAPPRRLARHPRLIAVPAQDATPAKIREAVEDAQVPGVGGAAPPDGPDREEMVLSAVRALVRPTASEVAGHCRLGTPVVHAALRALVASGQIARTETARGQEYALVSPGAVRPFKRSRNGSPQTETGTGVETPDASLKGPAVDGSIALAR